MKFVINYQNVPSNPTLEYAEKMVEKAASASATEVESVGGGSTIDVGKYVAFKLRIPHTVIPTTAGTGSEVTKFAVFIKENKKITIESEELIPDNYILDPSRIVNLNKEQTASTGLDALCQAIESYWSPRATSESRFYAKKAIRFASKNLLDSWTYPHSETLRQKMLEAANFSGRAINTTRTSICHAISYPLTIHYGIPHGFACAATMPFFIRYFNFKMIDADRLEKLITKFGGTINIPIDKDLVVKETLESERALNCPMKINENIIYNALCSYIFQCQPTSSTQDISTASTGLKDTKKEKTSL